MTPSADDSFGATIAAVQAKGFSRADRRYLMWVDANVYCGIGTLQVDNQPGDANANNGRVTAYSRVDNACWNYAEAHELMHNLGGVQPSAPNATAGGHCRDDADLMCYDDGAGPAVTRVVCAAGNEVNFDCGQNDYFSARPAAGSWLARHWNVANSDFLINPLGPRDLTPPPVPTGLTAVPTETSVRISWSPSAAPDIKGYRIYRDGIHVASRGTPSWTNTGLAPGVRYKYQVRAVDQSGNASALSAALVAGAVDSTPPSPPDLRSDQNSSKPKLRWLPAPEPDVAGYRVFRDRVKVAQLPATARTWQDPNFGLAVHRTYQVYAVDRFGNVSKSSRELLILNTNPLS